VHDHIHIASQLRTRCHVVMTVALTHLIEHMNSTSFAVFVLAKAGCGVPAVISQPSLIVTVFLLAACHDEATSDITKLVTFLNWCAPRLLALRDDACKKT